MSITFATDVIVNDGYKLNNGRIFSGACDTAAATTTKAVTCSIFKSGDLVKGAAILVTFTYTNSGAVASLKMNVNSTGDKPIKCLLNGALANLPAVGYLLANGTYLFTYDGTNWVTTVDRAIAPSEYIKFIDYNINLTVGLDYFYITPPEDGWTLISIVRNGAFSEPSDIVIGTVIDSSSTTIVFLKAAPTTDRTGVVFSSMWVKYSAI